MRHRKKKSNSVVCGESIQSNTGEAAALSSVRLGKILQSEKNRRVFKIALHFPFFKDLSPPSFSLLQSSPQNQSVLTLILKWHIPFFLLPFIWGAGEDFNIFLRCWIYFLQSKTGFEILSRFRSSNRNSTTFCLFNLKKKKNLWFTSLSYCVRTLTFSLQLFHWKPFHR